MANENNQMANVSQTLLGANDKGRVTYQVNGEDVNLSFQIVRNFLTRGSKDVSDAEVIQFISLCKANKLNPFVGEAWLVKYDRNTPAQMLTARDAFMKRAEAHKEYDGYQSGVIVIRNNKVEEQEGEFFLPSDQLVGGWAKVYRSDRKFPTVSRVRLEEYNTKKSTWAGKPATMIQKVAEAHAFRKAFPMVMSGLYTPEELPDEQEQRPAPSTMDANKALAEFQAPEQQPDPDPEVKKDAVDRAGENQPWENITAYDVCDRFCLEKNCDFCLGEHGEPCRAAMKRAHYTPDQEPAEAEEAIVTDAPAEPEPVPVQTQAAGNNEESLFRL